MKSLREIKEDLPGTAKYNANVMRIRKGTGLSATTKLYTAEFHRQTEALLPKFLKDAFALRPHHHAKALERRNQARRRTAEILMNWRKLLPAAARVILTGMRASEDTFNYNVVTAYDFYLARRHGYPVDENGTPILPEEAAVRSHAYACALVRRRVAQQLRKELRRGHEEMWLSSVLIPLFYVIRETSLCPLGV